MNNNPRKVIILSLAATLLGLLLFTFGLSISHKRFILDIIYYLLCTSMVIISSLALYNNYKKEKYIIYLYILCINIFLIVLSSFYIIVNHIL